MPDPTPTPAPTPNPEPTPAPEPAPSPEPTPPAFDFSKLDEGVRDNFAGKSWDTITDPQELLNTVGQSYVNLESKVGADTIKLPSNPDELQDWDGWKQLGVPEDGKYADFNSPKLPDGMNKDEKLEASFLEAAPGLKLTPFQVQGLSDLFADHQIEMMTGAGDLSKKDSDKMDAALRQEWGDDYDAKTDQAQLAARFMGYDKKDDPVLAALEGSLGASGLMQHFAKLGGMLGEDKLESVRTGGGQFGTTAAAASAEMSKMLDTDKRLADKSHPEHKAAVAAYEALAKIANPPKKT